MAGEEELAYNGMVVGDGKYAPKDRYAMYEEVRFSSMSHTQQLSSSGVSGGAGCCGNAAERFGESTSPTKHRQGSGSCSTKHHLHARYHDTKRERSQKVILQISKKSVQQYLL